mmetsp:Transcript_118346/g.209159  ORF Transcript_118346/g.209159 Transcript_118346/m.209159 type:complete len:169 (-) Transcript_118346:4-510(-)
MAHGLEVFSITVADLSGKERCVDELYPQMLVPELFSKVEAAFVGDADIEAKLVWGEQVLEQHLFSKTLHELGFQQGAVLTCILREPDVKEGEIARDALQAKIIELRCVLESHGAALKDTDEEQLQDAISDAACWLICTERRRARDFTVRMQQLEALVFGKLRSTLENG